MDIQKILRFLIYFFVVVIFISSLLIWINEAIPKLRNEKAEDEEPVRDQALDNRMKGIYTMPIIRQNIGTGGQPEDDSEKKPENDASGSTNYVVKMEGDFKGVMEKPKNPMQVMAELAAPKKTMVSFDDSDLDSEIMVSPAGEMPKLENLSGVPEPGMPAENSGIAMITVPVDYKIFDSSDVWKAFADAYKIKLDNDFSKKSVIALVSLSNFPPGIFAIKDIKTEKDEVIVRYTVNPLLMSEGTDEALRNKYAVDSIPKGIRRAKLVQVRQEFVTDKDN